MNIIIISIVNKYDIIIFGMRTTSFSTLLLLTNIILIGAVITIAVSLTDTLAISDKIDQKQIQQKEDDANKKNYQQMYKQYDFEKYLNYYYTYIPEYNENHDSNSDDDISEKNPFATAAIYNDFKDHEDNKKQQQQQQFNREKDDAKAKYILELDDRKDFSDDKKYSSHKNKDDKKTYKNIKIIECKNFNINAYEVEDLKSIATLLNKPTTFENDDYANGNQQEKSHNEKNSREVKEYDTNSNTKVIFICNNENHDLRPVNSGNNLTPQPLPNDGIILPMHSQNSNNNGEDKPAATTTTISYAQYKKSVSKD
jgi:hypothetical protein